MALVKSGWLWRQSEWGALGCRGGSRRGEEPQEHGWGRSASYRAARRHPIGFFGSFLGFAPSASPKPPGRAVGVVTAARRPRGDLGDGVGCTPNGVGPHDPTSPARSLLGSILRRWKRNWFVLYLDGSLLYYHDQTQRDMDGRLHIKHSCRDVRIGPECRGEQQPPAPKPSVPKTFCPQNFWSPKPSVPNPHVAKLRVPVFMSPNPMSSPSPHVPQTLTSPKPSCPHTLCPQSPVSPNLVVPKTFCP